MSNLFSKRLRNKSRREKLRLIVLCVNEEKNMMYFFPSIKDAAFLTKVNIRIVHDILSGKRHKKSLRGWMFYRSFEDFELSKNVKWDCEVHKVNLAPNSPCPLCEFEVRKVENRKLFECFQ